MNDGIAMRENDSNRFSLDRIASLVVVDHVATYQCFSVCLVWYHYIMLYIWLNVKNFYIFLANRIHFLWEVLMVQKLFNFQWTVYRSDCYAIKWSILSIFVELFYIILVCLPLIVIAILLFDAFDNGAWTFSQVSPILSVAFYLITFLGVGYRILNGENEALQKEIADKYKIKLVIPYWFWGAESTYSFDDFMEMVIFKSTDGYYITGENCFIFDVRTLSNPVFTNELSLLCAKHRQVNIVHYNTIDKVLTPVPVCYFFSKAPNAQAVTAPVYGKIMKKLSNSNFYWLFLYLIVFAVFLIFICVIIDRLCTDVPCYSCCTANGSGGYCYNSDHLYQCVSVCQGSTIQVTTRPSESNDSKHGYKSVASLSNMITLDIFLVFFMTYMNFYILYFIDQLFITTVIRIDSEHFRDPNYRTMDLLKTKSFYLVLEEAFREQMGGFEFDATFFSVLNSTHYYLSESVGIPVSLFRVFLNVFAIKQGRKISLRLRTRQGQCVMDSEFNPYVPTDKPPVVIYYGRMGSVWLGGDSEKEDEVHLSTKVLKEVILKR